MRKRLRGSRTLRFIRFLPYLAPYAIWRLLRPIKTDRILFLSDSHHGFGGNMAFLRDAIVAQAPEAEVIGVFKPRLSSRRSFVDFLRLPYLIATSRVIILDDFYPLIYGFPIRPGARLVQIWHAAGAFKRVGHSRAGLVGGPTPRSNIHRNYTDASVSSPEIVADYAEAFGIAPERVKAWGMPRSDAFFDEQKIAQTRSSVRAQLGLSESETFVLYAPTFRGVGQGTATGAPAVDWPSVAAQLGDGWRIGVRQHPFASQGSLAGGIVDARSIPEMNDLLMAADMVVTDYSSVIFEFALLRRPIVFFVPDLKEYSQSRAFYRPFEDYAIGPVVSNETGLADAIRNAEVDQEQRRRFLAEFCDALDGGSSSRIANHLLSVQSSARDGVESGIAA